MEDMRPTPSANQRTATMEDVAHRAGVSTATVSRSLKDDSSVTERTRLKVQQAASELGYVVHRQARALRSKRSGTVAVHVPFKAPGRSGVLADPFVLEFLAAVGTALHAAQLDMLVSHSAPIDLSLHRSSLVDGYVLLGHGLGDSMLIQAADDGVPLAVWEPPTSDHPYCAVGVDNIELARQATAHLIAHGRRRIAFVSADLDDDRSEGSYRYQGFRIALEDAGIENDESIVTTADANEASGIWAIREILNADRSVDAVFAAHSDFVALTIQRELSGRGISVPEDIAVVGFDNLQMGEFADPRLTTVDQGLTAGVAVLVDKLTRQINGETVAPEFVPGELVIRDSCGAHDTSVPAADNRE